MDKKTLLERYNARLIALERRAPLSAATYRYEIGRFLAWVETGDGERRGVTEEEGEARLLGSEDLVRYLDARRDRDGLDSRSVAKAIAALRSFFRFLLDEGLRRDDPAALLERPRRRFRLPAVLEGGEARELLARIDMGSPRGLRDRALYTLIYQAGLRVSEAAALNLGDLELKAGEARVRGKGGKERLVVFGPETVAVLRRYLAEGRPALLGSRRAAALFVTRRGGRLSRKSIWKNYAGLAALGGVSSKVHTLRHTFATELLRGGADLRSVQELLGHADITTTQIYTHLGDGTLREAHRRFLPPLRPGAGPPPPGGRPLAHNEEA